MEPWEGSKDGVLVGDHGWTHGGGQRMAPWQRDQGGGPRMCPGGGPRRGGKADLKYTSDVNITCILLSFNLFVLVYYS